MILLVTVVWILVRVLSCLILVSALLHMSNILEAGTGTSVSGLETSSEVIGTRTALVVVTLHRREDVTTLVPWCSWLPRVDGDMCGTHVEEGVARMVVARWSVGPATSA